MTFAPAPSPGIVGTAEGAPVAPPGKLTLLRS